MGRRAYSSCGSSPRVGGIGGGSGSCPAPGSRGMSSGRRFCTRGRFAPGPFPSVSGSGFMIEPTALGLVLLLVAIVRSWHDFHHANVLTYVYFLGLVGTLAAIATLRMWMLRRIEAGDGVRSDPERTA